MCSRPRRICVSRSARLQSFQRLDLPNGRSHAASRRSGAFIVATIAAAFVLAAGVNTVRLAREPAKSGLAPEAGVAPHLILPPRAMRLGVPVAPDPAFSAVEIRQGFAARRAGEVNYHIPVPIGLCWDVPLPCATETLDVVLKLRDPTRGLAAGFARAVNLQRNRLYFTMQ